MIMFSIFPVMFLCMQPVDANTRPKGDADCVEISPASELKPSDSCDESALPKQSASTSEPGLLSLILCVVSAAAVLFQQAGMK